MNKPKKPLNGQRRVFLLSSALAALAGLAGAGGGSRLRKTYQALEEAEIAGLLPRKRPISGIKLNETGAFVYARMDGTRTPLELAGLLSRRYQVSRSQALEDVLSLTRQLDGLGLLTLERA